MGSEAGSTQLTRDDLRQLFVKHRSGELAFLCDLGELVAPVIVSPYSEVGGLALQQLNGLAGARGPVARSCYRSLINLMYCVSK